MLQALIFDVDGTLADTESVHRAAFNQAFAAAGLDWYWDEGLYTSLLDISGGKERMLHYWRSRHQHQHGFDPAAVRELVTRLHALKTVAYARAIGAGHLALRPGVHQLLDEALRRGLRLAIATTTSPANIDALLAREIGSDWRRRFAAIGDGASAPDKKPSPQVYLQVLAALALNPAQCVALEDSGNGLRAATAAGLATLVTPTRYTADHDFSGAMRVVADLSQVGVAQLQRWHAQAGHASEAGAAPARAQRQQSARQLTETGAPARHHALS